MNTLILRAMCAVSAVVVLAAVSATEPAPPLAPAPGVLLLRNGSVLEGKIAKSGELYFVWRPDGHIRLAAADVELLCRDVEEGYRLKRAALPGDRLLDHLRLAEWCLRHKLLPQAAEQLGIAVALDPKHPAIGVLERRLDLQLQALTASPPIPSGTPAEGPIVTPGAVTALPPQEAAGTEQAPPAPAQAGLSGQALDRWTRDMPTEVVVQFTQSIQPLLLNHCTTSGCHLAGTGSPWELGRISSDGVPQRRTTQRNLVSTLSWIRRDKPAESPLLRMALTPHGRAKTAAFPDAEAAGYKQLQSWVTAVAPSPQTPSTSAEPRPPAPVATETMPAAPVTTGTIPASAEAEVKGLGQVPPPVAKPTTPPNPRGPKPAGPQPGEFAPTDPFDPEIFNRQFGSGR